MLSDRDIVATVAVKNLEAARRFYENTLGLPLMTENQEALTFKSGRSMLFVYHSQFASTNKATAAIARQSAATRNLVEKWTAGAEPQRSSTSA